MCGYDHDEIIGHNCRFLQNKDRSQEARFEIAEAIKNGENCVVEIRNYTKDGQLFYNQLYLSAVKDLSGNVT
ncbi:Blue-light photoreceptor [compost metagenome]